MSADPRWRICLLLATKMRESLQATLFVFAALVLQGRFFFGPNCQVHHPSKSMQIRHGVTEMESTRAFAIATFGWNIPPRLRPNFPTTTTTTMSLRRWQRRLTQAHNSSMLPPIIPWFRPPSAPQLFSIVKWKIYGTFRY